MRTQTSIAILAACLSATPFALGQAAVPDALGQAPQTQPLCRAMSVGHMLPTTPEQMAKTMQAAQLAWAAATSFHAGNYAQAEEEARQALAVEPQEGMSQEVLASALESQGKDQEALQQYQTVIKHYDGHPRNLIPYAQLLLKSGQWEQALAVYNQALPTLPDVGPHPEAIIVHERDAMLANSRFSPDAPEPAALATALHIARGLVYNSMCDWAGEPQNKEAMAEYQKALQLAPNSGLANYYYGVGWQKLGPDERAKFGTAQQAKAALQKAVKFGRGDVKVAAQKALMVAMKPQ
jgi:tetratricopeptide (TPR) repeat protein